MNAIFGNRQFWQFYMLTNETDYQTDDFLKAGLPVSWEKPSWSDDNELYPVPYYFEIPLIEPYSLKIKMELWTYMTHLYLNAHGSEFVLAGWDLARSHPFGLRWEEALFLSKTFVTNKKEQAAWLLLLAHYTGNRNDDLKAGKIKLLLDAYNTLHIEGSEELLKYSIHFRDDFEWIPHKDHGWVLNGDYQCYSFRNECHYDGDDGKTESPFRILSDICQRSSRL